MARYAKFFSVGGGAGPNGLQLPLGTVLDATLRQVQDGTGTGSPLYLSTGSVRIGTTAASAMYWDNTNSRLGIGTNAPAYTLQIGDGTTNLFSTISTLGGNILVGSSGNTRFGFAGGGTSLVMASSLGSLPMSVGNFVNGALVLGVNNTEAMRISASTYNVNINSTTDLTAKLGIKGSGSTSATTSLLVQNSSAVDLLKLQDNGVLTLGTVASGLGKIVVTTDPSFGIKSVMENSSGGQIIRQVSTDVIWFGGQTQTGIFANNLMNLVAPYITGNNPTGNTTGSSFDFRVSGSPYGQTPSTASRGVLFDGQLAFQSGGYANYFELSPTYTFDVSNNRIVRGIYYNPTLVTPNTNDKHIAIETVSGDILFGTTSGSVAIGRTSIFNNSALNIEIPITGNAINDRINLYLSSSVTSAGLKFAACNGGSWIQSTQGGNGNTAYRLNLNPFGEGVNVGTLTHLNSSLGIRGAGSTSATTSLLVQNSGGALSFKCTDDLVQQFNGYQTSFTHPTYTGQLLIFSAGNNQQTIRGGNGENIVFGAGGNTMNLNATEIYVSSSFLGSNFWIQPNGAFCLGQQAGANASAQLEIRSTTKGFLPPRVTTAQKNAISSPATGLMVFDTDLVRPCFFNGATWITL